MLVYGPGVAEFGWKASMDERTPYTGRPRPRKTRLGVRISEVLARAFITVGGIGTIIAIVAVFAFLVYVVFPLFQAASVGSDNQVAAWDKAARSMGVDEDQTAVWGLFADGRLEFVDLKTGKVLNQKKVFDGPALTAWSFAAGSPSAVFGFAEGSIRTGTIKVTTRFLIRNNFPKKPRTLRSMKQSPSRKACLLELSEVNTASPNWRRNSRIPPKERRRHPYFWSIKQKRRQASLSRH